MKLPTSNNNGAFTLIELLVVLGIVGILVSMLLPALSHSGRHPPYRIMCVNNQKQIGTAFLVFASDNGDKFPLQATNQPYLYQPGNTGTAPGATPTTTAFAWQVFQAMWNQLQTPTILLCPGDRARATNTRRPYSRVIDFNALAGAPGVSTTASLGHPGNQNRAISYAPQALADGLNPLAILNVDRNINLSSATNAATTTAWPSGSRFAIGDEPAAKSVNWVMGSGAALHYLHGNLTFADGRVLQSTATTLQTALLTAGKTYGWGTPSSPGPGTALFLMP